MVEIERKTSVLTQLTSPKTNAKFWVQPKINTSLWEITSDKILPRALGVNFTSEAEAIKYCKFYMENMKETKSRRRDRVYEENHA